MKLKPEINTNITKVIKYGSVVIAVVLLIASFPAILAFTLRHQQEKTSTNIDQFPVTVNPKDKSITENIEVNSYFEKNGIYSGASVAGTAGPLLNSLTYIASLISNLPLYQNIASVAGISGQFVTITPGMRKEQVADAFGKALGWTAAQKKAFLAPLADDNLPLSEGSFFPTTYFVSDEMTPADVQSVVDDRFTENVLNHYGTSTAEIVPLSEALTIASIIQRETIGTTDMRLISGIIWNRLFNGMNLQVDATLQYAKANLAATTQWWPQVVPKDKYIKSPYNTYQNNGLTPTPIAEPSVAAIMAALNPIKTPCLYYFNDTSGTFHCSATYAEHVALIKQYYGNDN